MVVLAIFARYFRLWIQSQTTGAGIGIFDLLGHDFRKISPAVIVRSKIRPCRRDSRRKGSPAALEAHYLAGGNAAAVIRAIIAARKAKIPSRSNWPRRSTWPAATCWRPCRRASIPR